MTVDAAREPGFSRGPGPPNPPPSRAHPSKYMSRAARPVDGRDSSIVALPFVSRNLFSSHFLMHRFIVSDPRWRAADAKAAAMLERIGLLFDAVHPDRVEQYRRNEANLEEHFIRPVLQILGHAYDVQETVNFQYRGSERPDYTLFSSEAARQSAASDRQVYIKSAVGLGEAKAWDVDLDRTVSLRPDLRANPSVQISSYLRDTQRRWGILTNGRRWRIYCGATSLQLDSFYEVDLVDLLQRGDVEAFKFFVVLFGVDAFSPLPSGLCLLDDLLAQSSRFSQEIEDDVKEHVYEALQCLVEGFLRHPDNKLTADSLDEIHGNSLILLYRLLFTLFAEAKGLLPVENPAYRGSSLDRLRSDIRRDIEMSPSPLMPSGEATWARLRGIFKLINSGSVARGIPRGVFLVPPYNGGLFSPDKHPFLERNAICDAALARAIDLLSYSPAHDSSPGGMIDYETLSIRHLGSIYEGLLEFTPVVATTDLVVEAEDGRQVYRTVLRPIIGS
jgi:hypothetical protein